MSAAELLEQVKALPPEEREKLIDAIVELHVEAGPRVSEKGEVVWPDISQRLQESFGDRIFENPVLAEREESDR